MKQLVGQGSGVSNIAISDKNIASFQSIARKYGVDFAVKKDKTTTPPQWLVFFKGRDADAITSAFKEYSAKQLAKASKPPILVAISELAEKAKEQVLDIANAVKRGIGR